MDFMQLFPPEILEMILCYVTSEDIKSCIEVSQVWRRSINNLLNWKKICVENDWFPEEEEDCGFQEEFFHRRATWRKCFWLNFNWHHGLYDSFNMQVCPLSRIHVAKELVVRVFQNRMEIWSFNILPRLEQTLSFAHVYRSTVEVFGNFLASQQNSCLQVYCRNYPTRCYKLYKEINLPSVSLCKSKNQRGDNRNVKETVEKMKLSDRYVAVLFKDCYDVYLCDLETMDDWITACNSDHIFQMEVEANTLFIVVLDMPMSCYKVRGYDLEDRIWDLELILFDNTPIGVNPPDLWVNQWFIMSLAQINQFQNRYLYTPLKVWNREGRFVALEFPNCARQPYFQCCLKDNVVVFTINESTVAVWEPHAEIITKSFTVERGYTDLKMCPGNTVSISYSNALQVWDWKTGLLLYNIDFKLRRIHKPIVNEQYYIYEDMEDVVLMKYHDICKTYPY